MQGALFLLGGVLGQRRPVVLWMWRVLIPFGFQERLQSALAYSMRVIVRKPGPYFAKCQSRQSGCAIPTILTPPLQSCLMMCKYKNLAFCRFDLFRLDHRWMNTAGSARLRHADVHSWIAAWTRLEQRWVWLIAARARLYWTEALLVVVWGIPGDDAGLLHAGALSIEGKHPSAAKQSDQASISCTEDSRKAFRSRCHWQELEHLGTLEFCSNKQ